MPGCGSYPSIAMSSRVKSSIDLTPGFSTSSRQWAWLAGQLQPGLVKVVQIEMCIAQGVHEVADLQVAYLSDQVGQQRVGGNVERHAEEDVG